ncbi:hypothetical protein KDA_69180 [Dictyobacter alpinus]|uniref:HTH merR-type domain-containing protein n=1 Tax=Dictyobacter alpinus TaxID=2014873 RepID=A0A402BJB3_9CHLR|nr:chaperone modulator CbpM [Dictyobacter alpinus]GCE31434.1 hypothetical protein KDA_69180 [Dictyobacter alpinus]
MSEPISTRLTKIVVRSQQESYTYTEQEILEYSHLEQPFVLYLFECGLIGSHDSASQEHHYSESDLLLLRRAQRLQRDLDINLEGIEVILRLLARIEELQRTLSQRPES